jgi:hypothetical protein
MNKKIRSFLVILLALGILGSSVAFAGYNSSDTSTPVANGYRARGS